MNSDNDELTIDERAIEASIESGAASIDELIRDSGLKLPGVIAATNSLHQKKATVPPKLICEVWNAADALVWLDDLIVNTEQQLKCSKQIRQLLTGSNEGYQL